MWMKKTLESLLKIVQHSIPEHLRMRCWDIKRVQKEAYFKKLDELLENAYIHLRWSP